MTDIDSRVASGKLRVLVFKTKETALFYKKVEKGKCQV